LLAKTHLEKMAAYCLPRWITAGLKGGDMVRRTPAVIPSTPSPENDFQLALQADSEVMFDLCGFGQMFNGLPLDHLLATEYLTELKTAVQIVRWYMIGLVSPQELNVYHPNLLLDDLRERITRSPLYHLPSPMMEHTKERMRSWWQQHTVTSAWRNLQAHVRIHDGSEALAEAVADFMWSVRDVLTNQSTEGVSS
jgi:hypothetical protein